MQDSRNRPENRAEGATKVQRASRGIIPGAPAGEAGDPPSLLKGRTRELEPIAEVATIADRETDCAGGGAFDGDPSRVVLGQVAL
jgi:hypothetical protein